MSPLHTIVDIIRAMPLTDVEIDPRTWSEGSETRRAEWKLSIREFLAAHTVGASDGPMVLKVTVTDQATGLQLVDAEGNELTRASVPRDALQDKIAEYVDIVRQLTATGFAWSSPRAEALDMAKKVVHNKAGDVLLRLLPEFKTDHETCRRLFSLLLTLRVDTSKLLGVHRHRPIR